MGRTPPGETRERVLAFVRERLVAGAPPTVREVQAAFGFRSVGTAREHLDALVADGRLAKGEGREGREGREGKQHRGLRLPGRSSLRAAIVPLLGSVQAGALTEAIQEATDHLVVESRLPAGELFALRVRGDSMAPEILADDVLIVRRQPRAENGEIVVALVDSEATVKRLRIVRGRAELHATNPAFAPIVPETLTVLGRVVELRRAFERRPVEPTRRVPNK